VHLIQPQLSSVKSHSSHLRPAPSSSRVRTRAPTPQTGSSLDRSRAGPCALGLLCRRPTGPQLSNTPFSTLRLYHAHDVNRRRSIPTSSRQSAALHKSRHSAATLAPQPLSASHLIELGDSAPVRASHSARLVPSHSGGRSSAGQLRCCAKTRGKRRCFRS